MLCRLATYWRVVIVPCLSIRANLLCVCGAQQEPIESHFQKRWVEYLNTEIVLGSVSSIPDAIQWAKSTFWYIRALKNKTGRCVA